MGVSSPRSLGSLSPAAALRFFGGLVHRFCASFRVGEVVVNLRATTDTRRGSQPVDPTGRHLSVSALGLTRMAGVARRHHTVPRFYLDNFAEAGQVGTVMLPGDRRFTQSVNNASAMTDFYAVGQPNAEGSDAFEKVLSTLETAAAPVVRKVLGGTWPLVEEDRTVLAEFATVQHLRGPDRRNHMQNMAAQFARMDISLNGKEWMAERFAEYTGGELDGEQIDRLWEQATRPEGPPLTVSPAEHIEQIVDLLPKVYWYFAARPWSLIRFSRQRLLTCDTPVLLVPHADHPDWAGVGLLTAWALALPLSPDTALLMTDPAPVAEHVTREYVGAGTLDRVEPANTKWARALRALAVGNARRFIYHHPNDSSLVPEDLPEPASTEIVAPTNDFVAMGQAMRESNRTPATDDDGELSPAEGSDRATKP